MINNLITKGKDQRIKKKQNKGKMETKQGKHGKSIVTTCPESGAYGSKIWQEGWQPY